MTFNGALFRGPLDITGASGILSIVIFVQVQTLATLTVRGVLDVLPILLLANSASRFTKISAFEFGTLSTRTGGGVRDERVGAHRSSGWANTITILAHIILTPADFGCEVTNTSSFLIQLVTVDAIGALTSGLIEYIVFVLIGASLNGALASIQTSIRESAGSATASVGVWELWIRTFGTAWGAITGTFCRIQNVLVCTSQGTFACSVGCLWVR